VDLDACRFDDTCRGPQWRKGVNKEEPPQWRGAAIVGVLGPTAHPGLPLKVF
jgi:hypothetical protein